MNHLILRLSVGIVAFFAMVAPARAQSKGAVDASATAYEIYLNGDYKSAAAAYEKLLKDFPTDGIAP